MVYYSFVHGTTKDSSTLYVVPANSSRTHQSAHQAAHQVAQQALAGAAAARLNQKVSEKADKVARKAAKHIESLDRLAAHLEALEVWTRVEPGSRRPRFSRETIAATAIRIADTEGIEAVSMRRIAAELDAGTMTLYHYVRTKDELLALVTDTVMAELVVPGGKMSSDWREAITTVAHLSRAMLSRHPWLLDITDDPNFGPNTVRHFDQSLEAVARLEVSMRDKLDLITMVDEYVFGYCLHQRTTFHDEQTPLSAELMSYVDELAATGDYPQLAAMIGDHGSAPAWAMIRDSAMDDTRFERNLSRLLDGFAAGFAR
jgi:AcrR family transcriptional regulator